jgi:hypothetical protein
LFVFLRLVAGFSRLSISDLIENEQGLGDWIDQEYLEHFKYKRQILSMDINASGWVQTARI